MIVELVGLPGAGKSTFARRLSNGGVYTKIKIASSYELIWLNLCFVFFHPVVFLRLFFLYVRYGVVGGLWYTKLTSVFLDYNAKYIKAKRYPYALLDQGHLQTFMSLFDEPISQKKVENLIALLPKPDHYVFFDIPQALRETRIDERGYVSRKGISDTLRNKWQETASTHFGYIQQAIDKLAPVTVDVVTQDVDIDVLVEKYQKARFMRYITFGRMPTEKAHGLQIAKMCEAFTANNVHVSLVTPKRSNDIHLNVRDYYNLKTPLQHFEAPVFDVIGSIKKVTSFHHYLHELLFAWAVFFMHIPKEVVVYTRSATVAYVCGIKGNTVIAEQHFWPTRGSKLHSFMLSFAKHIPCNSEGTCNLCLEHGLQQAFVAHNGVDQSFLKESITKTQARKNLGVSVDGKIIMYIGSLGDWKGVDTLAEAAKNFGEGVTTVVIGGTDDELLEWKEKYQHVTFLGSRPYNEIGQHQKAADVLVVPNNPISEESRSYTSPIKIFAHMASGVPMLVSDLPAMRNILSEDTAFFFRAGDSVSLEESVSQIIDNEEEANNRAQNAYQKSSEYTWDSRARNIIIKCKNNI